MKCNTCGLPAETCICDDDEQNIHPEIVRINVEQRRYGKEVTVIEIKGPAQRINKLCETLKSKFECGGTVEDRTGLRSSESVTHKAIELQGNHISGAERYFQVSGYNVQNIGMDAQNPPQYCQNCHTDLSEYGDVDFCPECGTERTPESDCVNCGTDLTQYDDVDFCPECGAEVGQSSENKKS
jgi:translation initiation factor 1 (eIF-1/SUI1)/predicted RNA-binding Zn-ribbon protein involved in translation (DUF1610 family)